MELVEVDVVSAEAAQAVFDGGHHVAPGAAALHRPVTHAHAEFGGDDHLVAAARQGPPEELLALPANAIDVRRIEEVDAELDGAVDNGLRLFGVAAAAEVVAAQAYDRDLQP